MSWFDPLQRLAQPEKPSRDLWILLGCGLILIGIGIGIRLPLPPDEPRFVLMAKEMIESGNWLIPFRGGQPYSDKPPVAMWLIALSYLLVGNWKWAFLLPSLAGGLITLTLVYDLTRRLYNRRTGLIAGLLLLFSVHFLILSKSAQLDMVVTTFMMLGAYGILRHLFCGPSWGWYFGGCIAMGVGIITKMIGFFPFFLALPALWLIWRGNPQMKLHNFWILCLGPILMVATAACWILPMHLMVEASGDPLLEAYRRDILLGQTIGRYLDTTPGGHTNPFWYYLVDVIPLFWLPLSLLLFWLIPAWKNAFKTGDARIILPISYALFVITFFTLSSGKRDMYIFSALPMLVMAAAPFVERILRETRASTILWWITLGFASVLTLVWPATPFFLDSLDPHSEIVQISPWFLLSLIGLSTLYLLFFTPRHQGHWAWAGFMVILWGGYSTWGAAIVSPVLSPISTMQEVYQRAGPNGVVAMLRFREQFLLYSERPMFHFGYRTDLREQAQTAAWWLKQDDRHHLLIEQEYLAFCFTPKPEQDIGFRQGKDLWLIDHTAIAPECIAEQKGPVFHSRTTLQE